MAIYLGDKQIDAIYEISGYEDLPQYFSRTLGNNTYGNLNASDLAGLKSIKPYGFYRQKELRYITLPETVEYIGDYAFIESDIERITFMSTIPPTLGRSSLPTGGGMIWSIPKGSLEAYQNAGGFKDYSQYLVERSS